MVMSFGGLGVFGGFGGAFYAAPFTYFSIKNKSLLYFNMLTFIKFQKKTTYIKIQPVNSTNAICFVGVLGGVETFKTYK